MMGNRQFRYCDKELYKQESLLQRIKMTNKYLTIIIAEKDIPGQELKNVVAKVGYDAVSVSSEPYEKKGLFSAFRG